MPAVGKRTPTNDFEWDAISDEALLNGTPKYRLALSLSDVERMLPEVRHQLLGGGLEKLDTSSVVRVGPRDDIPAIVFACDLLTAATICDIIRSEDRKIGDPPSAVWLLRKSWSRVSGNEMLTIMVDGEVKLNPAIFGVEVRTVAPTAPIAVRI